MISFASPTNSGVANNSSMIAPCMVKQLVVLLIGHQVVVWPHQLGAHDHGHQAGG